VKRGNAHLSLIVVCACWCNESEKSRTKDLNSIPRIDKKRAMLRKLGAHCSHYVFLVGKAEDPKQFM
jgi:hypothetical protein